MEALWQNLAAEGKCVDLGAEPSAKLCNKYATGFLQMCTQNRFRGGGQQIGSCATHALVPRLCEDITSIDLQNNQLGDKGASAIAEVVAKTSLLIHLDLSGNGIGPNGCMALSQSLAVNETLTSLNLSAVAGVARNFIGTRGAKHLAAALAQNAVLTELSLTSNGIGEEGATVLAEVLSGHPSLLSLDISYNAIGSRGAVALAQALYGCMLRHVTLASNAIGLEGIRALAKALPQSQLRSLDLTDNHIQPEGIRFIAAALHANPKLEVLVLRGNALASHGTTELAHALAKNQMLHTLDICRTGCTADGLREITKALCMNKTLTRLSISDHHFEGMSAAKLARAIRQNSTLRMLDLTNCWIDDSSGKEIAHSLRSNSGLQQLILKSNSLSCGTEFLEALHHSTHLLKLDLSLNRIDHGTMTQIDQLIKRNTKLHKEQVRVQLTENLHELRAEEQRGKVTAAQLRVISQERETQEAQVQRLQEELLLAEEELAAKQSEMEEDVLVVATQRRASMQIVRQLDEELHQLHAENLERNHVLGLRLDNIHARQQFLRKQLKQVDGQFPDMAQHAQQMITLQNKLRAEQSLCDADVEELKAAQEALQSFLQMQEPQPQHPPATGTVPAHRRKKRSPHKHAAPRNPPAKPTVTPHLNALTQRRAAATTTASQPGKRRPLKQAPIGVVASGPNVMMMHSTPREPQ